MIHPFQSSLVQRLVDLALEEDLCFGDLSSAILQQAQSSPDKVVSAEIIARERLVICGLPITRVIAERANVALQIENLADEGQTVEMDKAVQRIKGLASEITTLERTILNFLQRMSGVATYTRDVVEKTSGIIVLDTRKTLPGFRVLDKYATAAGGARNHRMNLSDVVLIKNNHIDAAAGENLEKKVRNLLSQVQKLKPYYVPFHVEVRSQKELDLVLEFKPTSVLLDNMQDSEIIACLETLRTKAPQTLCEVSGGVDASRLRSLSALGVPAASMGSLTTKATNVDISLRILQS